MFERRDGKLVCVIHPDTEITRAVVNLKRSTKLIQTCAKCDQLVEELRKTKCDANRFLT